MTRTNRLKLEESPGQVPDNPNAGSSGGPSRSAAARQTPAPSNHSEGPSTGSSLTGPKTPLAPSPYAIHPSTNSNIGIRARTSALDAVADSILAVVEDEQRRTPMPVASPLDGPVQVSFRHPVVSNPYAAGTFVMHSPVSAVAVSERTVPVYDMLQRSEMLMQERRDFAGLHPTMLHIQDLEDWDTITPRELALVYGLDLEFGNIN